jgi:hypothetical protein
MAFTTTPNSIVLQRKLINKKKETPIEQLPRSSHTFTID